MKISSDNFPELRTFAQSIICRFGTTYRCEQAYSAMKLIKSKTRLRLSDSNLRNTLVLSVRNLTTRIEKLAKSKQPQIFSLKHVKLISFIKFFFSHKYFFNM